MSEIDYHRRSKRATLESKENLTMKSRVGYSLRVVLYIAGRSFNGRTAVSGSVYRGSNPCLPATIFSTSYGDRIRSLFLFLGYFWETTQNSISTHIRIPSIFYSPSCKIFSKSKKNLIKPRFFAVFWSAIHPVFVL